ncbi:hypothetical protein FACS1894208_05570 [Clostridia bacterium]|nr:hypothetical protein FACS1894208_05570 [Clostridia bacterium]
MSNLVELTSASFKSETASGVTLVDLWAPWCGPCRMVAPVVARLAEDYAGRVKVGKLNVDDHGGVAAAYGVQSIPTLLILKDGTEVERMVGARPIEEISAVLERNL